jgi:hypothetical protein
MSVCPPLFLPLTPRQEVLEWHVAAEMKPRGLTRWSTVLLEKLIGFLLVKKFPALHGKRGFITAFTRVRHLSLTSTSSFQYTTPHFLKICTWPWPIHFHNIPNTKSHDPISLLRSYQSISPGLRQVVMFHTTARFDSEELSKPRPSPKLEDTPCRQGITRKEGRRPVLPKLLLNLLIVTYVPILWLLCIFRSLYSVYCLCVHVYCTTATGCQPNCS